MGRGKPQVAQVAPADGQSSGGVLAMSVSGSFPVDGPATPAAPKHAEPARGTFAVPSSPAAELA
eukprot:5852543-Lingulodinium_polyedra.AAC.1